MCPILPHPANGRVELTGKLVDDTATYTCNEGYELVGDQVLTCLVGGNWDNPPPICRLFMSKQLDKMYVLATLYNCFYTYTKSRLMIHIEQSLLL